MYHARLVAKGNSQVPGTNYFKINCWSNDIFLGTGVNNDSFWVLD